MTRTDEEIEQLTEKIIGCGIEVHRVFGPGLLESIYQECMNIELRIAGLTVESGRHIPLEYKGRSISGELKLDLVVEGCIVVELKAVEQMHPIHQAQVITYLKLTGFQAGSPHELQRSDSKVRPQTPRSPRPIQKKTS